MSDEELVTDPLEVTEVAEPEVVETVPDVPVNRPHLFVTGVFDDDTVNVLQWALGVKQTKVLDTKTISALQKRLGIEVTGEWSRETRYALQKNLGTPLSTTFSTASVKALQTFLGRLTGKW